jgi:hypothetical protein
MSVVILPNEFYVILYLFTISIEKKQAKPIALFILPKFANLQPFKVLQLEVSPLTGADFVLF